MKFDVSYDIMFAVTREVEIDEYELEEFAERHGFSSLESAAETWLQWQDSEFEAEVFSDWKTDEPLPGDFEFQYLDVLEAVVQRDG